MKILISALLMFVYMTTYAHVDCTSLTFVSATASTITIDLPTTNDCINPTYVIRLRENGSGDPLNPYSNWTLNGAGEAVVSGLEKCTEYDFRVDVYCNGKFVGGCVTELPFSTSCDDCPCEFEIYEIETEQVEGCLYFVSARYEGQCTGEFSLTFTIDFGDGSAPVTNGTGATGHIFPGNGTYTVHIVGTLYDIDNDCEVTTEITQDVEITGCGGFSEGGPSSRSGGITVTPNPVKVQANILVETKLDEKGMLQVFSKTGEMVKSFNIVSNANNSIDLHGLSSDIYYLKYISPQGFVKTAQLVVEK